MSGWYVLLQLWLVNSVYLCWWLVLFVCRTDHHQWAMHCWLILSSCFFECNSTGMPRWIVLPSC